ncbi:MAG: GldG family protein [Planctomycetota bacterium]|nr:GldG family protein [Planctomycetota bacterium]
MADSRQYRKKYYINSGISLVLLLAVLSMLSMTADETSGLKMDFTKDGLYTISDATKDIFGQLEDKVKITYYCSEELPSFLATIVRDTEDQFEELRKISDGKLRFEIVNPDDIADEAAAAATDAYMADYDKENYEALEEPEPPMDIQAMMAGRQRESPENIRKRRQTRAKDRASATKKSVDEAYREILLAEFKQRELRSLAEVGVNPYIVPDRTANSVKQLRVYSSIKISYLDRPVEVIPFHSSLESLEYELAYRIVKVTQPQKPVVAFFDARKPPAPPVNPAQPTQAPPSDYAAVINFLQELVDVRQLSLKEGDSLDDLVKNIKGEAERKRKEELGEEPGGEVTLEESDYASFIKCLVVAQPDALEDRQIYEINRAVSMGIPTVFLVSPYTIDISQQTGLPRGIPITLLNSGLEDLFKSWGVSLGDEMLASNNSGAIMLPRRVLGNLTAMMPTPVSFVVSPSGESINTESSLTNRIPGLALPATAGLKVRKVEGLEYEELANCGEQSWSVKIDPLEGMNNPFNRGRPSGPTISAYQQKLMGNKNPEEFNDFIKPLALAAFLKGKFAFRFEGESVPEWKKPPAGGADPHSGIPGLPPGLPPGFPPGLTPGVPPGDGDLLPNPADPLADEALQEEAPKPAPAAAAQESPAKAQPAPAAVEKAPVAAPATTKEGEEAPAEKEAPKPAPVAAQESPAKAQPAPAAAEKAPVAAPAATKEGEEAPAEKAAPPKAPAPKAHVGVKDGRVLFLSSVDMLKNDFVTNAEQLVAYRYNAEFFRNCIENFALDDRLMKIRRKNLTVREFKDGSDEWASTIIFLNLVGLPFLVGILGLLRYWYRSSRSVAYERDFLQGR